MRWIVNAYGMNYLYGIIYHKTYLRGKKNKK